MRFLCDMGVSLKAVAWLREQGHDCTHLREEGLQRLRDEDVFRKAAAESRTILTFDLDFGEILARAGSRVPSVVLFRLRNARANRVIERLSRALERVVESLDRGAIVMVGESQTRIRELPIRAEQ
jgi:predicted nuclease of predicted toxin-antitoxin system